MIIAELAFEFNRIFSRQKWEGVLRIFKAMTAAAAAAAVAAAAAAAFTVYASNQGIDPTGR